MHLQTAYEKGYNLQKHLSSMHSRDRKTRMFIEARGSRQELCEGRKIGNRIRGEVSTSIAEHKNDHKWGMAYLPDTKYCQSKR